MKNKLLWKLLLFNTLPVIVVVFLVIWFAVDKLAANYFMALMKIYDINPDHIHRMFLTSVHYYLIWASLAGIAVAICISFFLTRKQLRPLSQMTEITRQIAAGKFDLRADVVSSDEVGQLGIAFNNMADRLGKIERLRKAMVADVAHELRTPLTNLRGYLEALNDGVIPPSPETLAMLQQENLRLVSLVDNLQQLARAEAANSYLNRETIKLRELIDQMLQLHRLNFEEKQISVSTSWQTPPVTITGDRDKLLQAIQNLLDNCRKYTPVGGSVTIIVTSAEQMVKIAFVNSGPPIAPEHLPFIFERFYRADRSRSRHQGGAGIGLAITRELIEAHGGSVGAESVENGTCVWISLPV